MEGVGMTVNGTPPLETPPTVTITGPVVVPEGTGAVMLVLVQPVGAAITPLSVNVLAPWVGPKFEPATVTVAPTGPAFGVTLVIVDAMGLGATTRESADRVDLPSMSSLTFMFLLPGPTVIEYPAATLNRSLMPITTGDVVVHETVYAASLVVSAVVPVAWHNDAVTGKLRPSEACGNTV